MLPSVHRWRHTHAFLLSYMQVNDQSAPSQPRRATMPVLLPQPTTKAAVRRRQAKSNAAVRPPVSGAGAKQGAPTSMVKKTASAACDVQQPPPAQQVRTQQTCTGVASLCTGTRPVCCLLRLDLVRVSHVCCYAGRSRCAYGPTKRSSCRAATHPAYSTTQPPSLIGSSNTLATPINRATVITNGFGRNTPAGTSTQAPPHATSG